MDTNGPLVSIVICTYNRASMLPVTIESALTQDYPNTEIILYDDGSTDHTSELAALYAGKIRYIKGANKGIATARTSACQAAHGELIAFLDDDDLMPKARIQILLDALDRHPTAKFAVGELALINQQGEIYSQPELSGKVESLFTNGCTAVLWPLVPATVHTTLFRRADGEAIGWFDASYDGAAEDKDFFCRLGHDAQIVYVPKVVSLYRRGHTSLTGANKKVLRGQLRLFSTWFMSSHTSLKLKRRLQTRIRIALQRSFDLTVDERKEIEIYRYAKCLNIPGLVKLVLYRLKKLLKQILASGGTIAS